ncbi:MAG: rhomboid family intramembrane serine protease [Paramuribaculum sp.]|nr:rhomboid family intramembrane serine protease [Candidatus Amulumruptor sp.]MDE6587606.1 rhomboid family intramembrane serine protease [Paramuribaculum sp.]MDE7151860.1 rhomboid family intramembrane serine protease [Candidatus Amulumruptor sp.]MDE7236729.1 rhomboid family intramembrane serine protease [Paramuribaculum sp.]
MNNRNIFAALPPVTKNLIIINFAIWLMMMLAPASLQDKILHYGGLHFWGASDFNPAQLLTYMFMHSTQSFAHILFNMFTLFMFGITLERVLGSQRYLFYYISCGIGAALVQEIVWQLTWVNILAGWINNSYGSGLVEAKEAIRQAVATGTNIPALNALLTIGASGAIYGVLLAFGMIFPNRPLYLMFVPVPIKAKWMVAGYGVIELLIGLSSANDGVAHFAHLGGMIFGFFMIWYWKRKGTVHGDYFY